MKFIHRDLKPENIFFKNGKIKVGDFGLCKLLSDRNSTRSCAGSLLNMAPEILRHESYDNKVDIYSIGTVLYQMLFGRYRYWLKVDLLSWLQLTKASSRASSKGSKSIR